MLITAGTFSIELCFNDIEEYVQCFRSSDQDRASFLVSERRIIEQLSSIVMINRIVILIYLMVHCTLAIDTNVTVDGLGIVTGLRETTAWTNRIIYSFRGIPYAEPPIGDLRFRVSDDFDTVPVILTIQT